MYAVIKTGGKQYRVKAGDTIRIEKISGEPGKSIEIPDVLLLQDGATIRIGESVANSKVRGTFLRNGKARKELIFKKSARKQYRRTRGHRQEFTEVRIDEIVKG